jgi:putative ABC transport system permease protein
MISALHRLLLRAYPRRFRDEFGDEMARVFDQRVAAARTRGRLRAAFGAAHGLMDAIVSGLAERLSPGRSRVSHHQRRFRVSWQSIVADVRFALRLMRRAPLYSGLAMLALGLGIGANGAIFTAVDSVLRRPLPYRDADSLVMVWSDNRNAGVARNPISPADYLDYRQMNQSLEQVEAMQSFLAPAAYRDGDSPDVVQTSTLSAGMFRLLGRDAMSGRMFQDGDSNVVMLSYGFWQRRYGADVGVVNRQIALSNRPYTVIGIMPPDFVFPYRSMLGPSGFNRAITADVWTPIQFTGNFYLNPDGTPARRARFLSLVGRLRPGLAVEHARADLQTVAARLADTYPDANRDWSATVLPLHEQTVGSARSALLLLLAGVGVLLLMASVNVANLVLARSLTRQREMAVRSALGASRLRLIQQTTIEGVLLAAGGGLIGALAVYGGISIILMLAPIDLPRRAEIRPDLTVFMFTLAVTLAAGLLAGLIPAVSSSRADLQTVLKESGRSATPGRARRRLGASLVVAEVSMAVLLTLGATLLVRSFVSVLRVDPGFASERVLTFQMNIPSRYATPQARQAFYDDLFARLDAIPGVVKSGGTTRLPLGSTNVTTLVMVEGRDVPAARLPEVELRRAMHDYFEALGIPLLRGRVFAKTDDINAPGVVVINKAMERRVFPGEEALGRRVRIGTDAAAPWLEIVGVIGDVKHASLEEVPKPELYIPARQGPPVAPFVVLRTSGIPGSVTDDVRAVIRTIDSTTPVYDFHSMNDLRRDSMAARRFVLTLVAVFGALGLTLAAIGVYGVTALSVSERSAEMGVRLALGAAPSQVFGLVVGQTLRLGAVGIVVGLAAAFIAAPVISSELYGVEPTDVLSFLTVVGVLLGVALVAAFVPARRAMRVDPVETLRRG